MTIQQQDERLHGWVPEMDLADRLRKTLRVTEIGVSDMARQLGVTRETIGSWINGRITPRRPALLAWAGITGADLEWLETGQAPTSRPAPDDSLPRLDSNQQPSGYASAQVIDLAEARIRIGRRAA